MTEYDALIQAGFQPGQNVLVTGASSGVGSIGLQLAKALGAGTVVVTTRSHARADMLRELGADLVIDTNDTSIADALHAAGRPLCDATLDHVGGRVLSDVIRASAPGARIIQIGRLGGGQTELDLDLLAIRRLSLIGTTFRSRGASELHQLIANLIAEPILVPSCGGVHPIIDSTNRMTDAEGAAAPRQSRARFGKVLVKPHA